MSLIHEMLRFGKFLGGSGGGASSWNDLKDKPFGEETVTVNEPLNITWDGNTEGLVGVTDGDGNVFGYKVSDAVLTDEQIKLTVFDIDNGGWVMNTADRWDSMVSDGSVTADIVWGIGFCVVRKAGLVVEGCTYPETGVYFYEHNASIICLYTTEPIEQTTTVVKKIDEKYLPDVGGVLVIETDAEFDKVITPLNDIRDAWQSGTPLVLISNTDSGAIMYTFNEGSLDGDGNFYGASFVRFSFGNIFFCYINQDGSLTTDSYTIDMAAGR